MQKGFEKVTREFFDENYVNSMLVYNHIQDLVRKNQIIELLCPNYHLLSEKYKKQFMIDLETFITKYSKKVDKVVEKRGKKRMEEKEKKLKGKL